MKEKDYTQRLTVENLQDELNNPFTLASVIGSLNLKVELVLINLPKSSKSKQVEKKGNNIKGKIMNTSKRRRL